MSKEDLIAELGLIWTGLHEYNFGQQRRVLHDELDFVIRVSTLVNPLDIIIPNFKQAITLQFRPKHFVFQSLKNEYEDYYRSLEAISTF